ncbi:hypothetical protein UMM65_06315 [Aureibaculum sp. 2210JD6-5]|uniref:hypothetical protein n=1 Tax=Aureibaculum sp. 2210JD6-5 TaxID=3103957 RepID=UPI002AAE4614|nr:hypothetical protein [Aureibaculum sp. 2210JD6-5]MDY7394848.1 hypothetical protein [Aureibaculum sp. 2210JD6-5]
MKNRPVLIFAMTLAIVVEVILIILIYHKIGDERLPGQIVRLLFQLILIAFILIRKSNIILLILSGYYIITGIYTLYMISNPNSIEAAFSLYNIVIGIIIYFHDWIENRLNLGLSSKNKT